MRSGRHVVFPMSASCKAAAPEAHPMERGARSAAEATDSGDVLTLSGRPSSRIFEELRAHGYEGGYDAVRRCERLGEDERERGGECLCPADIRAGAEAYRFRLEPLRLSTVMDGAMTINEGRACPKLCHSRMMVVRAYPRETQEMVFDAHERAFAFLQRACGRGRLRQHEDGGRRRSSSARTASTIAAFFQICSPHLVEPVACTPAVGMGEGPGREPGRPRPRTLLHAAGCDSRGYDELNAAASRQMRSPWRKRMPIPSGPTRTIWQVFEAERPKLIPYRGQFRWVPRAALYLGGLPDPSRYRVRQQQMLGQRAPSAAPSTSTPTPIGSLSARMDGTVAEHPRVSTAEAR